MADIQSEHRFNLDNQSTQNKGGIISVEVDKEWRYLKPSLIEQVEHKI